MAEDQTNKSTVTEGKREEQDVAMKKKQQWQQPRTNIF